jgi:hypothetical protein
MPRRAAPGRRDRIEAALTPTLRSALEQLRELFDIRGDWQATGIAAPFQAAACVLLAAERVRAGEAPHSALTAAAAHLGLSDETVRSWCVRWSVRNAHTAGGTTAVSLIADAATALPPDIEAA